MIWFSVRRLALLIVSLAVASVVIFLLLHLLPGDAAQVAAGTQASPAQVEQARHDLGLDKSFVHQYASWVGGVVHGDLGSSVLSGVSVSDQLNKKLGVTVPLVLGSTTLSILVAVPLGIFASIRHRRVDGVALSALTQLGIALPTLFVGLMLIVIFGVHWELLPTQGFPSSGWRDRSEAARSLVLPVVTLAIAQAAVLTRFVRSAMLDVLHQEYIRTARAKGLTRLQAITRHGIRNAALPIVSVLGVQVAGLLAGVVVIERVFSLPGIGQMLLKDVGNRDIVKVESTLLVITAIVLLIGFLVDVALRLIDPRLRSAR
ncbi:MAG: ABC transporter permease [Ilumatobacteraceae bacterium]